MDFIFIEELRLDTLIGVYDWERHRRQTIQLDL
jgi:dihydroneopterin aldolase